jgi:HEAT repeat protein
MNTKSTDRPFLLLIVAALTLCTLVSCGGGGEDDRARTMFVELVAENNDQAKYAAEILAGGSSAFALEQLKSLAAETNYKTATAAIRAFTDNQELDGEEVLRDAFENRKGALQVLAAVGLARRGDEAAIDWVEGKLSLTAGPTQVLAMRTLAEVGREAAVIPILESYLENKEESLRDRCYQILSLMPYDWSREMLERGLEQEFGERRRGPILGLGRVGNADSAKKIARFSNTKGLVFVTAEALGWIGNAEAAEQALRGVAGGDEETSQVYANVALLRLGLLAEDDPALETLSSFEDPRVRAALAEQLVGVEGPRAMSLLSRLSEDEDGDVREAALLVLAPGATAEQRALFTARLQDKEPGSRILAIETLAKIGTAEDLPALEEQLEHSYPYLRIAGAYAIIEITSRGS